MSGPRIAYVDIETFPAAVWTWSLFKPVIGIDQIISQPRIGGVGWMWEGQKSPRWIGENTHSHEDMLKVVRNLMDQADILVHWNGDRFDEPWLQAEFALYDIPEPSPCTPLDLMKATKRKLRLLSYKLDYVAQYFGLGQKIKHGGFRLWVQCMAGDEKAWRAMARYCKQDVLLLPAIRHRLLGRIKHPHVGLWADDPTLAICGNCGSDQLQKRGFAYTSLGKFQQYVCTACGRWHRVKKAGAFVDVRPVA